MGVFLVSRSRFYKLVMDSLASGHRSGLYSKTGLKSQMEVNDNTGTADSYLIDNRNKR